MPGAAGLPGYSAELGGTGRARAPRATTRRTMRRTLDGHLTGSPAPARHPAGGGAYDRGSRRAVNRRREAGMPVARYGSILRR